ncbi:hypothetical protein I302_102498 [Kwoniella bestiolae CBS 10118]|uniref:Enoyl reductase (ER) domain-containing protein n=1 Tax=Kwoniella bestiolae CBS 10118 TaxID=1296100 RepID=A0A1B9GF47_9TREE|nr:hypothetical protein I302_01189 [Kwoniella bestiolae CBS 10118]OCF29677.1 hypothetical protein I302_01189 [Kwoniella bestiolae CBS 10118]
MSSSSLPKEHKVWLLKTRPSDSSTPNEFELITRPTPTIDDLQKGQVLIKNTSFGNDPAQRVWMDGSIDPRRLYVPPILKGQPVRASAMGTVVLSKSDVWKEGDKVYSEGDWAEYSVVQDSGPLTGKEIHIKGQSEYITNSILGLTGQTAWVGVFKEMELKPEHVLVVSGAAGAVGSTVIQIAKKVIGVKTIIGIAGGKEKCDWVKSIGADDCVDYKDSEYPEHLKTLLPDYADRFFDNVGGEILDTMLTLVKRHGHVTVCGAISGYNGEGLTLKHWGEIIYNRITIKGMLILDHASALDQAVSDLTRWVSDGTISNTESETVVEGKFEDIPKIYNRLFSGQNKGKLITKLIDV